MRRGEVMPRAEVVRRIEALGVIAVVRLDDSAQLRPVVDALVAAEIGAVELTMTTPGALEALASVAATYGDRVLLGVGSVLDAETARLAILAGAHFVVAPTCCVEVVEMCHRYGIVAMPGAYTPTEVVAAWQAGADFIKLFPAGTLGPDYIAMLREPLPQLRIVPTGGVNADNAGAFLAAGAVAVGVGGSLVDRTAVSRGDYTRLIEAAHRLKRAISAARERST